MTPENGTPKLLTLEEAARLLGMSARWVRVHGRHERLLVKLGNRTLRVDEARLHRYIERNRLG